MTFFTRPGLEPVAAAAPLTAARVAAVLDRNGWAYGTDEDGDLGGMWDDHTVHFLRLGEEREVLQVRARWRHVLPAAAHAEVLRTIDGSNRERIVPKLWTHVDEAGVAVFAETTADGTVGLTDEQVERCVLLGLYGAMGVFEQLEEELGHLLDADADDGGSGDGDDARGAGRTR